MAATTITCAQVSLQARLVVTSRSVGGVAGLTWILALTQSVGLFAFSVDRALPSAIAANAFVALASSAIVIILAARVRSERRRLLIETAAAIAGLAFASAVGGPSLLGTVGAGTAAFVWLPQAVHSVRARSHAGLSTVFVLAGISSSALWITYASLEHQWRLDVAPMTALVAMVVTGLASNASKRRSQNPQAWCARDDDETTR